MKTTAFIFCFFILLQLNAQQQPKLIYLLNKETKLPVAGASIRSTTGNYTRLSGESGMVLLNNFNGGELGITCIGYAKKEIMMNNIAEDGKIFLDPVITSLQEVKISGGARSGIFHTISDLDIDVRPVVNSQEVLRMVPGLFIGQHAGGGKAEQIFLRGFDIDHGTDIAISVDGIPVNMVSHAHGQGYADLHFLIPEMIEKVDFNKGPYFSDKGNFATAGYVGFRTKDHLQSNFVKLEAGQFNTFRAVTGINLLNKTSGLNKNQSLIFAGEASYTKGYFESPQNFKRFNGILKYHTQIGKRSSLTSYISGFTSGWNASGQIPGRAIASGLIGWYGAIDNTEGGKTSRYNVNNTFTTNFNNGIRWKNQLYYTKYRFELYSNFTFFLESPEKGDQIKQKENRDILGFTSNIEKDHQLGSFSSLSRAGIQTRYDNVKGIELSNTENRKTLLKSIMKGDVNEFNGGIFVEERVSLTNKLDVTAGIRGDYFSNRYADHLMTKTLSGNSFIVSPKLNIDYSINDAIKLYWYNGQGIHSNDTRVAIQKNGQNGVTPAWGTDIGGVFKLGKKAMLQSALWYLWLKQEFVYVGDAGIIEPSGKTGRIGMDASLRYEIVRWLYTDIDLNYTYARAMDEPKGENYIPLAPVFTSSGGFTYRKSTGWNGSIRYRYMDSRPANEDNSVIAKGYFICDAAINYTQKKWESGIAIQNIFNTKWKETQFDTESRLYNEPAPVSEIHFTPGTPFFLRAGITLFF
ncbi:MAG: TonB-dependent receptor [Chitinophagaceae bacterium]|nr:TonB-dependent receptor [Chitinophagaceae bacterium]